MKELCSKCLSQGQCRFVSRVDERLAGLPPSEKQNRISPDTTITQEASIVNEEIAKDRIVARSDRCPQVNYNPQNQNFQPNL